VPTLVNKTVLRNIPRHWSITTGAYKPSNQGTWHATMCTNHQEAALVRWLIPGAILTQGFKEHLAQGLSHYTYSQSPAEYLTIINAVLLAL